MFKLPRKTTEPTKSEVVRETLLTEVENRVIAEEISTAKSVAEIYDIITKSDNAAEKRPASDQVKVAWISAAASLAGIVAVIHHEQVGVVASKALGFIVRPRI